MYKKSILSRMTYFIPVFCLIIYPQLNAQSGWQNPSDRYINAYKDYLNQELSVRDDGIHHFVYFARDRDAVRGHSFLNVPSFAGAQIMYSWRELEPEKDRYDFSAILEDYEYLQTKGKKLFIQLQDTTFNPNNLGVPDYLMTPEYGGGAIYQRDDNGNPEGWAAKRWNPDVRKRFAALLDALGKTFDGIVTGINLQETAIGVSHENDPSFSPELYAAGIKANMLAMKKAFPKSVTMQYANFMPGEWLPWDDLGYLRSIYQYGQDIGVGLGAPDLMVERKPQLNHALALMHEGTYTVPVGIAVQDGNYIGRTGTNAVLQDRNTIVPLLHAFAKGFLGVDYMFWSYQEPYFREDVIPYFTK